MLMNDEYQPINCDDYDNLELACQHKWILKLELRDGEVIESRAIDLLQKKRVEYLVIEQNNSQRELRLDHIKSFSHPKIGTVVVSLSD
ncbi:Rho-binding antiterminator [Serratia microhaemolytica]|uniref:Rho-binding antiterminator n=1 Tax=Serratia microhaemolytica TaxID=2675110 RepID=UPI000FDE479D|nr:Rho-binding antiterminator [Serratia microhaemolytica]